MAKKKPKNKTKTFRHKKIFFFCFTIFALLLSIPFLLKQPAKETCANSISCINDLRGIPEKQNVGTFMGKVVTAPQIEPIDEKTKVLGTSTTDKHIFIDLTNQKLTAMENGQKVMEFLVSTGLWGRTPTGDFMTWIKLRSTRMQGGSKNLGTFYDLPNVPYTMYFYNDQVPKWRGFGVHGAYWHNNFGHPMSHGCVNLSPDDAKALYEWANPQSDKYSIYIDEENPGTPITIYGTAPLN